MKTLSRTKISYNGKEFTNLGDFHTHTIYSLHGMSSPTEMVNAAFQNGFNYIALTDHHYVWPNAYPYDKGIRGANFFNRKNQEARIWEYDRSFKSINNLITVIPGYEYNLFPYQQCSATAVDMSRISYPHLRLIGLHSWYYEPSLIDRNILLDEIEEQFRDGNYHILVHSERELDRIFKGSDNETYIKDILNEIVDLCAKYEIIMEVNNSSIIGCPPDSYERNLRFIFMRHWLKRAKEKNLHIVVNSDAHSIYDVGDCGDVFKILSTIQYPESLIINFDENLVRSMIIKRARGEA